MLIKIHWLQGRDGMVQGQICCKQEGKIKSLSDCKRCALFSYATDLSIVCDWLPERNYVMKEVISLEWHNNRVTGQHHTRNCLPGR